MPTHPQGNVTGKLSGALPWVWVSIAQRADVVAVFGALRMGQGGMPPHTCTRTFHGTHIGRGGSSTDLRGDRSFALDQLPSSRNLPGTGVHT